MAQWAMDSGDVQILRQLAGRLCAIAHSEENLQRKERWLAHNALQPGKPMVLVEVQGLERNGEHPVTPQVCCKEQWAREVEWVLRIRIFQFEQMQDDLVTEPYFNIRWNLSLGNFGVETVSHTGSSEGKLGSYVWDAPIQNLGEDLKKLKFRERKLDREGTYAWKQHLEGVFGDLLPVRIRGSFWWTMGLTSPLIRLIGLEQLMLYMVDDPEGLHRVMTFMRDEHLDLARWCQREGLLTLNNENDYIGSGSTAYTRELPKPEMDGQVRMKDLWVLSESQETVGVGPEMFGEFIFPYQKTITDEFGLCYYGCCEPVHTRWHILRQMGNLRKVSISPWCDEAFMARECSNQYVYSRKPNPTQVSTEKFDEEAIRQDLRKTISETRKHGCNVELVMKDVHTVQNQPERLARWVQIAREESEQF